MLSVLRIAVWLRRISHTLDRLETVENRRLEIEQSRFLRDFPQPKADRKVIFSHPSVEDFDKRYLSDHPELEEAD